MQGRHPRHVDPIDVYMETGPAQHDHDRLPVRLLDRLLEHDLVRKPHSPQAGVLPGEERSSTGHADPSIVTRTKLDGTWRHKYCLSLVTRTKLDGHGDPTTVSWLSLEQSLAGHGDPSTVSNSSLE